MQIKISQQEKVAFCGDIHFDTTTPSSRLDNYMDTCCQKIDAIGDICQQENVRYLFFAGDIFNRIQCTHECVNRAGEVLLALKQKNNIRLFAICGNHDLPRDSLARLKQSPIETLFRFGVLEHVDSSIPVDIVDATDATKITRVCAYDFTQKILPADKTKTATILLAHMFFNQSGVTAIEGQNITKDEMASYGYDMAFLGHDHEEHPSVMCKNTLVVRSGSLMRGTSHDYNFTREPGFVIVDNIFAPQKVRKVVLPYRPFKEILSQAVLSRKAQNAIDDSHKEALQGLAAKLAEAGDTDGSDKDTVLEMIQTDTGITDNVRNLLLSYIARVS